VVGAQQVEKVVNALMSSTSYNDSVFMLTWDEGGGLYDHVPPATTVNPDGIPPNLATDTAVLTTFGDNFTLTGFRVPLIVVSPWTKKGYISHTAADYTAILKFIETRFGLPSLTLRDAAQFDMTEFFDFTNTPNATPPVPPVQVINLPCYFNTLP
jgi:phospholipase C